MLETVGSLLDGISDELDDQENFNDNDNGITSD